MYRSYVCTYVGSHVELVANFSTNISHCTGPAHAILDCVVASFELRSVMSHYRMYVVELYVMIPTDVNSAGRKG
jgi:hypothetical protein